MWLRLAFALFILHPPLVRADCVADDLTTADKPAVYQELLRIEDVLVEGRLAQVATAHYGTPHFDADVRLTRKGRPPVEHKLACSEFGNPRFAVEGQELLLEFAPSDTLTIVRRHRIDPKSLTIRQVSEQKVDEVSKRKADFERALKGTDPKAILASYDKLAMAYENPDGGEGPLSLPLRERLLARGFELANRLRLSGKADDAAEALVPFLEPSCRVSDTKVCSVEIQDVVRVRSVALLNDAAFVLERGRRWKEAAAILKDVIRRAPKRLAAYRNLADAQRKLGLESEARATEAAAAKATGK